MTLNEIGIAAVKTAEEKGFHETEHELRQVLAGRPDLAREAEILQTSRRLALIHSEVSEALEAVRKNKYADLAAYRAAGETTEAFKAHVKDSFEDELADAVIRLAELAALNNVDLDAHIAAKMAFNAQRPHKFGKAF